MMLLSWRYCDASGNVRLFKGRWKDVRSRRARTYLLDLVVNSTSALRDENVTHLTDVLNRRLFRGTVAETIDSSIPR
jgi:hypothetical protein